MFHLLKIGPRIVLAIVLILLWSAVSVMPARAAGGEVTIVVPAGTTVCTVPNANPAPPDQCWQLSYKWSGKANMTSDGNWYGLQGDAIAYVLASAPGLEVSAGGISLSPCASTDWSCRFSVGTGKQIQPMTIATTLVLCLAPYVVSGMERKREAKKRLIIFWVLIVAIWFLIGFLFWLTLYPSADARWGWIETLVNIVRSAFGKTPWSFDTTVFDDKIRTVVFATIGVGIPAALVILWIQAERIPQVDTSRENRAGPFATLDLARAWLTNPANSPKVKAIGDPFETVPGNSQWMIRFNNVNTAARRDKSLVSCVLLTLWLAEQVFFGRLFQLDLGDLIAIAAAGVQLWETIEEVARQFSWLMRLMLVNTFWTLVLIVTINKLSASAPFLTLLQPLTPVIFPLSFLIVDEKDSSSPMGYDWINFSVMVALLILQVASGWKN